MCGGSSKDTAWSTRCIQPTSLRVASSLCQGEKSCSIPVSVTQFGDPCPDTPKYLELVYTCEGEEDNTKKIPDLPQWLINMESITNNIINKQTTRRSITTTTEPTSAQATSKPPLVKSQDYIRRPSKEFLLYIKQREEERIKRMRTMIKNKEQHEKIEEKEIEEENTVIVAIVLASIGCIFMIVCSILIILYQNSCKSRISESDEDVESTTSTYLQYSTNGSDYYYQYQDSQDKKIFSTTVGVNKNFVPYATKARFPEENDYVDIDKCFGKL